MQAYILRRLILVPVTLFIISIIVFIFMRAVPGDAGVAKCGAAGSFDQKCFEVVRQELGLDKPKVQQYWMWLSDIFKGDLGFSPLQRSHVNEEVWGRLWNTFQIGILSLSFTVLIGIPIGAISAIRSGKLIDYILRFFAILGISVPNFWIATLIIFLPAYFWQVRVAPDWVGWEQPLMHLRVLALPAIILSLSGAGAIARIARSSMLEVLSSDFVRTARAKGLRERVTVTRHVFRPSMITIFTIIGLQFSLVLGGSVIMEAIFGIQGIGLWVIEAIAARDFVIIQAIVMLLSFWFLLITLLVDVAYAWVDPRIRYS
tara:strand:- start:272 stop:1219 length:948 start_codon:yes stop_codon:yes gene_type:complete